MELKIKIFFKYIWLKILEFKDKGIIIYIYIILFSLLFFFFFFFNKKYSLVLVWNIIRFHSVNLILLFYIDWISLIFGGVVLLITNLIINYRISYMSDDLYLGRFIFLLILFRISILLLIFRLNLISLILGWDGLGVISYLLVVYYRGVKSFNSGIIVILRNRVGDVILLMRIVWIFNFGSWNFIFYLDIFNSEYWFFLLLSLLIVGGITKRAQIPFRAWLPAAMAAPTPVSALVHSSTLVTAGIYLILRFYDLFILRGILLFKILFFLGVMTILIAGITALFEYDLKKIIALSTLSQLGLIIMILRIKVKLVTFFHLLVHAIFKALLFICAGLIIHSFNRNQDIRYLGNLVKFIPLVSMNLNISNLALIGFPFLAGFYSKDLIIQILLIINLNKFIFVFIFFSLRLTIMYRLRLRYFLILKKKIGRGYFIYFDSDYIIIKRIFILICFSIFLGRGLMWIIFENIRLIYIIGNIKILINFFLLIGCLLGVLLWGVKLIMGLINYLNLNNFFRLMWFLPNLTVHLLNLLTLNGGKYLINYLELGWLDYMLGHLRFNYLINWSFFNYKLFLNIFKIIIYLFLLILFFF